MKVRIVLATAAALLSLGACGERVEPKAAAPDVAVAAVMTPTTFPVGRTIDRAQWSDRPMTPEALTAFLIRAQALLARARFSPGVIDGQDGENLKNAIAAFERAHGLPEDGWLDEEVWKRLSEDAGAVMGDYVITAEDIAGPFTPPIAKGDYAAMAEQAQLNYATPLEALAEKFHMDEALLQALNPGVDFGRAGQRILVVSPPAERLPAPVATVEVDKSRRQVRTYAAGGALIASYPATVGSSETPTPDGVWAVNAVTRNPAWNHDPDKLDFGDRSLGKVTIAAGPNNPVGAVWIDLTKETYGIHGTPDPRLIGKRASHGCVRLTNWDADRVAQWARRGTPVVFR